MDGSKELEAMRARHEAIVYGFAINRLKALNLVPEAAWLGIAEEFRALLHNTPNPPPSGSGDLFDQVEAIIDRLTDPGIRELRL